MKKYGILKEKRDKKQILNQNFSFSIPKAKLLTR